ncbi:MAG: PQQ-dependent sugar dehydrogenase [Gammaproteobacteria bacterium]|nr:PQQ-dependent sugar dehydrogenase [Gammaproteobacteria bacterium]
MRHCLLCVCAAFTFFGIFSSCTAKTKSIELPPGFHLSVFTDEVEGARQMALGDQGTVFVGTRSRDVVYAVREGPSNSAPQVSVIARGLNMPSGVAYKDGALYVAAVNQILRYDDIEAHLDSPPKPVVITDQLPKDTHHGWKYIRFGPDGFLYVPVGMPCNICRPEDPRYGSILKMDVKTGETEIFAHGVRNSVGFDWHPRTKTLWFTDNGQDWLGDDLPPEELNHAPESGLHFGFPFVYGQNIPNSEYAKSDIKEGFIPPAFQMQAHTAPLGLFFYTGAQFPEKYQQALFIAQHGSWNRSSKVGYQIRVVWPENALNIQSEVFAKGWLVDQRATGRPVAFLQMGDGSLLLSDDHAGTIYRISYSK